MTNTSTYKRFLSLVLVLVLMVPGLVKITHQVNVHLEQQHHALCKHHLHHGQHEQHEHHHLAPEKPELSEKHKDCPICNFHFVEFFSSPEPGLSGKPTLLSDYCFAFGKGEYFPADLYSFHLRGPPARS